MSQVSRMLLKAEINLDPAARPGVPAAAGATHESELGGLGLEQASQKLGFGAAHLRKVRGILPLTSNNMAHLSGEQVTEPRDGSKDEDQHPDDNNDDLHHERHRNAQDVQDCKLHKWLLCGRKYNQLTKKGGQSAGLLNCTERIHEAVVTASVEQNVIEQAACLIHRPRVEASLDNLVTLSTRRRAFVSTCTERGADSADKSVNKAQAHSPPSITVACCTSRHLGGMQLKADAVFRLFEIEGHIVLYTVVVMIGKPTERTKPGNREKRDSQILMMQYLSRVHLDAPMSPMELEVYHQMRNVIGIDPAFYEYIFTVDADTAVTPESLNRLVAAVADDSSIIGICGETRLDNEDGSWWTMIQVYEYYISHHMAKAFEWLFGSVSCLPGCFSMYRIRTADKGRPIIISNRIIEEYSEPNVDTLHKKNLLSLGEDRFLTTLLMKHFPTFRTKFTSAAIARMIAHESWRVLFSQRRRWINSTVHNLCELVFLPEMIGFCCFSMPFLVFIDLLGTLILPATVVYLFYLIIVVATGKAAFPLISIVMIAAVYVSSRPWGNPRLVIGEGSNKKVIMNGDEKFDDSMIPLKKSSEYEAEAWETGSRHSDKSGYNNKPHSHQSPRNFHEGSQACKYCRDANPLGHKSSDSNLRGQASQANLSQYGAQPMMSQYILPQLLFMPMGGRPGVYGMMLNAPRNTIMTNLNMYGGEGDASGSPSGFAPPGRIPAMQRPMSMFSLATSVLSARLLQR
ncbi:glycosyltransferase family 2 protein [Postia placenta MAD-698-R-SB12]|uniref:chitin synthase n=1 Tax=Postia placenta MAD-698-R-SB12 TaxID=670580 RepID=A0A1X6MIG7_9APHY|nr:glycosyltransferase family 2 protein [Postia placenta MAD-698-R-SB12]OSX56109.1 glycosyltransferase family 2 protein [Postia placenta MAD-698-R-SB12]